MYGIGTPIQSIQDKAVLREYAHALNDGFAVKADAIKLAAVDLAGSLATVEELHKKGDWDAFNRFL